MLKGKDHTIFAYNASKEFPKPIEYSTENFVRICKVN